MGEECTGLPGNSIRVFASIISLLTQTPESSLVRSIGTVALAASIVNITIGGGIFRLPADMAGTLGPTAPLAYLLCAVAMGLIVLCMAEAVAGGLRLRRGIMLLWPPANVSYRQVANSVIA